MTATALDGANTMPLQTAAWLRANQRSLTDSLAELDLRERIVAQRAGDFDELAPYFRLALARARSPLGASRFSGARRRPSGGSSRRSRSVIGSTTTPLSRDCAPTSSAPLAEIPEIQ
jgi:hypothetical protein